MKKLFGTLMLIFMFVSLALQGQDLSSTYTDKQKTGKTFNVESGTKTAENIVIEGSTFSVYETSKGTKFLKGKTAEGQAYPIWIGEKTSETFQGYPVRIFKSGTKFYLKINGQGNPSPRYLAKI